MDARQLLDSLMGPSRDKSAEEQQKGDGWKERNVCKRYLVGFCPNNAQDNWFHNTRRDVGTCSKVHSDRLKDDFEKHPDRERYQYDYEKDFLDFLEGLVREADAWIAREKGNCAAPGTRTKMTPTLKTKMVEMQEKSEKLMQQAEDLAEKGDVNLSKQAVETSRIIKEEIKELKEKHTYMSEGEQVCTICGVRCNPDEKADYQAHLDGRLHDGYTQIRAKVQELRERVRNGRPPSKKAEGGKDDDKERRKDNEKGGKDDDKERGKDKEKGGKDDDKERGKDKEKGSKEDDRDRKKDKDRGNKDDDREKKKANDKDRDRDRRERDKGKRDRKRKSDDESDRSRSRSRDRRRR